MDALQNKTAWKMQPDSPYYDANLLQDVKQRLKTHREASDMQKLITTLRVACTSNLGGIENQQLYSYCYSGTKNLVQDYVDEGSFSPKKQIKKTPLPSSKVLLKRSSHCGHVFFFFSQLLVRWMHSITPTKKIFQRDNF
jgi:hypothetical protein